MENKGISVLVVEDEFMIAEDISMRLSDFGYNVAGVAPSASMAIEILEGIGADLALVDINIDGDMDGIALAKIISSQFKIPFIYLTSLASNAIVERAKSTNPSAYLLKPFNDRQVQIAIEMALVNYSANRVADKSEKDIDAELETRVAIPVNDSLFLKRDSHYERVKLKDILYLSSQGNYTVIHTTNGYFMYSNILKDFETMLPSNKFFRIHRSFVVNVDAVTGMEFSSVFIGEVEIPVSKTRREAMHKMFKVL
jgi:DNA-binding LytR/AlgR family response regulator